MERKKLQLDYKTLLCEILIIVANVMNVYILTCETDNHHMGRIDILKQKVSISSQEMDWCSRNARKNVVYYMK
jgi:hypothetical protein